ncbi:MAG: PAS domain-containing protein [Oligosphaeraceae bacterium]|nr:PAS domain-containing protein [Oligosphaeraceae bacterium]
MDKKNRTLYDRLVERMDQLDPSSLQVYMMRLVRDKGFLESIFNSLHEGLIVIDNDLKIRIVNRAALEMFGMGDDAAGEYIGKYFKQFDWQELLQIPPENWGRFSRRELEVFYPRHRFVSFYLLPVPERPDMHKRGLPLATIIFHDITESRQESVQHIETQKIQLITQMAASLAHEIGNPLNSLGIHLQIIKRKLKQQEDGKIAVAEVADFINIAEQEIARLDAIVKNFLDAVRPGTLQIAPIELRKLLSEAIGFMRPEIEGKNIQVEVAFPDSLPLIAGDSVQLTQAFFNIIKNAIQAMPDGGMLNIVCSLDDVFLHIKFADSGKGLDGQELSRLLEPYYSTKSEGHGLGLVVVDRVVRAHGGELSVETGEGMGATFTISLPRHAKVVRQITANECIEENSPARAGQHP